MCEMEDRKVMTFKRFIEIVGCVVLALVVLHVIITGILHLGGMMFG